MGIADEAVYLIRNPEAVLPIVTAKWRSRVGVDLRQACFRGNK
jgi:hypothetical protein